MLFYLCCIVLIAALLAGGGTHSGFLAGTALQLLAIPLLCAALWRGFSPGSPHRKGARLALWLGGIAVLISALHLCPLFGDYWSGRSNLLPKSAHVSPPLPGPHTLSIAPEASWAAALSLIVPLSIFAATVQLRLEERLRLCFLMAGFGALSLLLGFLQVAQGPSSILRFYEFTNPTEAVGFFANRNHFADFLNVTLVLAALWFWIAAEGALGRRARENRHLLWLVAAGAFFVAIAAGLTLARSRAGIGLAILALSGILLIALKQGGEKGTGYKRRGASRAFLAVVLFAIAFALQTGFGGMFSRFESDPLDDARPALSLTTLKAAFDNLPFGTGLGSFVHVYATVERREDAGPGVANRAHNDAAELLLETGVPGAVLLLAFLVWYARSTWRVCSVPPTGKPPLELLLERTASLIVGLLLVHSLVDYPLRTAALGSVFSFCCALLAVPAAARTSSGHQDRKASPREKLREALKSPAVGWDADVPWPGNWQKQP
jgi:O-antigen ligase